ncbi:MAG: hypothetical protein JNN12_02450 [Bacteroidetes Order II. Incertae sedis bacterium]|nr:hypothetical protein [Bacteroidetes Order II. bacterium]
MKVRSLCLMLWLWWSTILPVYAQADAFPFFRALPDTLLKAPLHLLVPQEPLTVNEGEAVRLILEATGGREPYLFESSSPFPAGSSLTDNLFKWTPGFDVATTQNRIRPIELFFSVRDAEGVAISKKVLLNVRQVNRSPKIDPTSLYVTILPNVRITHELNATDEDNDLLRFEQSGPMPSGASLSNRGVFQWTATPTQYDRLPISISFKLTDGEAEIVQTLTLSKYDAGLPPAITQLSGKREVREAEPFLLRAQVYDPDGLDDLAPMGIEGNPPEGYQLSQEGNVYTFSWTPPFTFISSDAAVKKQTLKFTLFVVDRNGKRADLPVELDVLDAPDHGSLYNQYRDVLENSAREIDRIQDLQQVLSQRASKAERSKNRRAVLTAVISAATAIMGAATKGTPQIWGSAVGGGLTALLASLERTTIFPNPTQFTTDSDKLIESLIDLRVRAATYAVRYNAKEKRTRNEFQTEYADLVRAVQTCRDKVDAIAKKYDRLGAGIPDALSDTHIRQLVPGFSPDL